MEAQKNDALSNCPACGAELSRIHCTYMCPVCGFRTDCSDLQ